MSFGGFPHGRNEIVVDCCVNRNQFILIVSRYYANVTIILNLIQIQNVMIRGDRKNCAVRISDSLLPVIASIYYYMVHFFPGITCAYGITYDTRIKVMTCQ